MAAVDMYFHQPRIQRITSPVIWIRWLRSRFWRRDLLTWRGLGCRHTWNNDWRLVRWLRWWNPRWSLWRGNSNINCWVSILWSYPNGFKPLFKLLSLHGISGGPDLIRVFPHTCEIVSRWVRSRISLASIIEFHHRPVGWVVRHQIQSACLRSRSIEPGSSLV